MDNAVAAANKDDVAVGGDRCNDDGTTTTEAVGKADATIAITTAEGGDNAPAPGPPSTHPSGVAPRTTSDSEDEDDGAMNEEVDNGTRMTTMTTSTTSGEEDNDGERWATSRKRAVADNVGNDDVAAAGGTIGVSSGTAPSSLYDGPPPRSVICQGCGVVVSNDEDDGRQRGVGRHRRRCAGRGRERRTGRSVANAMREWCKS